MNGLKVTVITALMGLTFGVIAQEVATTQETATTQEMANKTEVDPNDLLKGNGDFEQWSIIKTKTKLNEYYRNAMKGGWSFTTGEKENTVLIPKVFNQCCEFSPDKKGIIRKSDKFHTGKAALELEGSFYLNPDGGIPTIDSDVYNITFYVYGDKPNSPIVHATVSGDNNPSVSIESHDVEDAEEGKWVKVTETLKVVGSGTKRISFRISSNDLMLIDDLTITKQE